MCCDVCLHTPCHPRCPNAPDPPIVYYCNLCIDPIYEGDEYYDFGEEKFCYNCVQEAFKTAEVED